MKTDDQLRDAWDRKQDRERNRGKRRMLTGRRVSDSEVTMAGAPTGKFWVRADDYSREQTAAWGYVRDVDVVITVKVGFDGDLKLDEILYSENIESLGDGIHGVTQPPLIGEETNASWPGVSLKPGRVRVSTGSDMNIVAEPLHHSGGYWDGATTASLTSYVPTNPGEVRWVVVDLVRATNTLTLTGTTATNLYGTTDLPESQAAAVALAVGNDRLGAVALKYGMTVLDASTRIIDMRRWADALFDHGELAGLADDDHTQYSLVAGTRPFTGDVSLGAHALNNTTLVQLNEGAAPGTPASGKAVVYAKTDGKVYSKDDAGTEYNLTVQLPESGMPVTATATTTDATLTDLLSIAVAEASSVAVRVMVTAHKADLSASYAIDVFLHARRATAGNVTLIGTPVENTLTDALVDVTIFADTTAQTVDIQVTGIVAETWKWRATAYPVVST